MSIAIKQDYSLYIFSFKCGCVFNELKPILWSEECAEHAGTRLVVDGETCRCLNFGLDDGVRTCWSHHDCTKSDCSHNDGGSYL